MDELVEKLLIEINEATGHFITLEDTADNEQINVFDYGSSFYN